MRILEEKQPRAFVLENVKQLTGHDKGRTLRFIMQALAYLGYHAQYKVLNALDFSLPQKRERIFIVGFREPTPYKWPTMRVPMQPLENLLEKDVAMFYHASSTIRANRLASHAGIYNHYTIWHENKGGHISAYPYSCALRAGASYNYLLVNGERRLTEREMLRLQGFPDTYQIVCGYAAMRKLTGNSVAVPVVKAVVGSVLDALQHQPHAMPQPIQRTLLDISASITLSKLSEEFKREFARTLTIGEFLEERQYLEIVSPPLWSIDLLQELKDTQEE